MNYYNTIVSLWNNKYDKSAKEIRIGDFLTDPHAENLIRAIRNPDVLPVERDILKAKLPAITVSSNCGIGNRRLNAPANTGLIMLDIDGKQNRNIPDMTGFIQYLKAVPFIWYAGLSAGGKGVFCIVPISDCTRFREHWYALEKYFAAMPAKIDPEPKSPASLRYQSWNNDATNFFNHDCIVFDQFLMPYNEPKNSSAAVVVTPELTTKVKRCIEQIEARRIDICADGGRGSIIAAFAHTFGIDGVQMAYDATKYHDTATIENTRSRLISFLGDYAGRKVSIGTFFEVCRRFGIR